MTDWTEPSLPMVPVYLRSDQPYEMFISHPAADILPKHHPLKHVADITKQHKAEDHQLKLLDDQTWNL